MRHGGHGGPGRGPGGPHRGHGRGPMSPPPRHHHMPPPRYYRRGGCGCCGPIFMTMCLAIAAIIAFII